MPSRFAAVPVATAPPRPYPSPAIKPRICSNHARDTSPAQGDRLSARDAPRARHAAGQPRLQVQPGLPALPRQREPRPQGDDGEGDDRPDSRRAVGAGHRHPRRHRRRAGAEPAFPASRPQRARRGRARDRPLQPDDHQRAGLRGSRRLPGARGRRDHRLAAVLHARRTSTGSAATTCSSRRSSRCRSSTRSATAVPIPASC